MRLCARLVRRAPFAISWARAQVSRGLATHSAVPVDELEKIPVTILTGFLGSGKTTLLNRILGEDHGLKLAVIQNEFGEVGVDHLLVADHFEGNEENPILQMNNGCLCCTVRSDLIPIIEDLFLGQTKTGKLDGIIVETTGLAVPGPIAQTFLQDSPSLMTRLDAVISVVDAKNVEKHWEAKGRNGEPNEVTQQIAFGDLILLNKVGLVAEEKLASLQQRIRTLNPRAPLLQCDYSDVPVAELLNIRAFDLDVLAERGIDMGEDAEEGEGGHGHSHGGHSHGHSHGHGHGHGNVAAIHDDEVISISIVFHGSMDTNKIEGWLGGLLAEQHESIYRMKGIMCLAGERNPNDPSLREPDSKLVYQGVHDLYTGEFHSHMAPEEPKENRLVFIGKGLDEATLRAGFEACVFDE